MTFRAVVIEQTKDGSRIVDHSAELRELPDDFLAGGVAGTVTGGVAGADGNDIEVDVEYSGINYKDGLAIAGKPGIVRSSPLIPGIDLVGTVLSSRDHRWEPGTRVVLNGDGIGESRHGGLSERARVSGDALVRVPDAITSERAAAIGTAGFTAMLSVLALERGGVTPGSGPVLVTGSAGGVGSVAIAILARLGYQVTASTGRSETQHDYLARLGASSIIDRGELSGDVGAPLQKQRWAGVLDAVGSTTLANALAQTVYGGTVTACGLAQGSDLPATVLPFILRGVTLAGVNSVEAPLALREQAWQRLSTDLDTTLLDEMTQVIALDDVFEVAGDILAGNVRGRTVVDVRR
jgi:acrylyl-CoA reductase (NADPH)